MEFFVAVIVLILLAIGGDAYVKAQRLRSAQEKIKEAAEMHLAALARKRLQTLKIDEYGIVDSRKWSKEVDYFLARVVLPQLSDGEKAALSAVDVNQVATELIEKPVREYSILLESRMQFDANMSGVEYERYCAALLSNCGWTASVTKASGDQGADIVAHKQGRRIVVQCKKYTGSVGNAAVQEAFAAMRHYQCSEAVVVTTGSFTAAAKQLAATTGVRLLHHSELAGI